MRAAFRNHFVAALLPVALLAVPASSRSIGQLGLALKTGENAGGFGAQASYNFDAHWQAAAGVGGASIPWFLELGDARTDSYFVMGKYYFKHLYFGAGYSVKRARLAKSLGDVVEQRTSDAHGIPLTLGYEFGHRKGFYFSSSIGFLQVFKNGGQTLRIEDPANPDNFASVTTASSGPSMGLSIGYYFDMDR